MTRVKVVVRVRPTLPREEQWAVRRRIPLTPAVTVSENAVNVQTVLPGPDTAGNPIDRKRCRDRNSRRGFRDDRDRERWVWEGCRVDTIRSFCFDRVFDEHVTQEQIYQQNVEALVDKCLEGYNATILAYGQTGSGKTYTMDGISQSFENRGITPRSVEQIFKHIRQELSPEKRFLVRVSYFEIYKDNVSDLLRPERQNLSIREGKGQQVYVEHLSEWIVKSPQEMYKILRVAAKNKKTRDTGLNKNSSRSHSVLQITVERCEITFYRDSCDKYNDKEGGEVTVRECTVAEFKEFVNSTAFQESNKQVSDYVSHEFKVGTLTLVDLAGSERVNSGSISYLRNKQPEQIEETKKINRSLAALSKVIHTLSRPEIKGRSERTMLISTRNRLSHNRTERRGFVPYRDSKLTRILQNSIGGNCLTLVFVLITKHSYHILETLSSLKFARKARTVRNVLTVNKEKDVESLLKTYQKEVKRLRRELEKRDNKEHLIYSQTIKRLEDEKRKLQEEKLQYLKLLENRSLQYMKEKMVKQQLQKKIKILLSQIITYGHNGALTEKNLRKVYSDRIGCRKKDSSDINVLEADVEDTFRKHHKCVERGTPYKHLW